LAAMGVPEGQDVLRLSFVHYTRKSEIDHVLNVLNDIL